MMWFAIISLSVIILGWFFWDKYKMEQAIKKTGGLSIKYRELIDILLETIPHSRIIKERRSYLLLGSFSFATTTIFEFVPTFSSITITYKSKSLMFGKHKLRWQFPINEDQEYMFYKINKDINEYLSHNKKLNNFINLLHGPESQSLDNDNK